MSTLGVEVRSRSLEYALLVDGEPLVAELLSIPVMIELVRPGGDRFGALYITDSTTNYGAWVVIKPFDSQGNPKRHEIVELGVMKMVEAFPAMSVKCVSYIPD